MGSLDVSANLFKIYEVRLIDTLQRPIKNLVVVPGSDDVLATAGNALTTEVC